MKRTRVRQLSIDMSKIARLQAIFENQEWRVEAERYKYVFDDFCKMLAFLDDKQQDLVLHLTESFLWIEEKDYLELFFKAFCSMLNPVPLSKRIILVPLASAVGTKQKSAQHLYYLVETNFQPRRFQQRNIEFVDSIASLLKKVRPDDIVCLIDDFIGTGTQALTSINELIQQGICRDSIAVVCLVAQNIGYQCLQSNGISVSYAYLRNRGISDNPQNKSENYAIMQEIETVVKPPAEYCFGSGRTEALVKMIRTPNNTFPVFWYTNSNSFPVSPFPRRPAKI